MQLRDNNNCHYHYDKCLTSIFSVIITTYIILVIINYYKLKIKLSVIFSKTSSKNHSCRNNHGRKIKDLKDVRTQSKREKRYL